VVTIRGIVLSPQCPVCFMWVDVGTKHITVHFVYCIFMVNKIDLYFHILSHLFPSITNFWASIFGARHL